MQYQCRFLFFYFILFLSLLFFAVLKFCPSYKGRLLVSPYLTDFSFSFLGLLSMTIPSKHLPPFLSFSCSPHHTCIYESEFPHPHHGTAPLVFVKPLFLSLPTYASTSHPCPHFFNFFTFLFALPVFFHFDVPFPALVMFTTIWCIYFIPIVLYFLVCFDFYSFLYLLSFTVLYFHSFLFPIFPLFQFFPWPPSRGEPALECWKLSGFREFFDREEFNGYFSNS